MQSLRNLKLSLGEMILPTLGHLNLKLSLGEMILPTLGY